METLRAMSTLWPSAGRAWELVNGCRATLRRPELVVPSMGPNVSQNGMRDSRPAQYPQSRLLTKAQSLSHLGRSREELKKSQTIDTALHQRAASTLQPPHSAYPHMQRYSPQQNANDQLLVPWNGVGDNNFMQATLDNSPLGHSRSASVGSQRDPSGGAIVMPHFWTDPFTDSSLLTSNYYGLPNMVDRQRQPTSVESDLAPQGFSGLPYVPYGGAGF